MKHGRSALSNVISTVILTSVMIIMVTTSSFFANDVLNGSMESVQFDQAINAILSVDRMVKNLMFKEYSTGMIRTSFPTTYPHLSEEGMLSVSINENVIANISMQTFKIQGGGRVGVSMSKDYIGNNSLMLAGLDGSISHVQTYQSEGAWVSLDYNRIRCIYCGQKSYYNGSNPNPTKLNIVEISIIKLISGEISPLERSRIIIENLGTDIEQYEFSGDLSIEAQIPGKQSGITLSELGGNSSLSTVVNLTIVNLRITILGGS